MVTAVVILMAIAWLRQDTHGAWFQSRDGSDPDLAFNSSTGQTPSILLLTSYDPLQSSQSPPPVLSIQNKTASNSSFSLWIILMIIIIMNRGVDVSWLPYSTYLYLDFHLCSMTKLKEHSRLDLGVGRFLLSLIYIFDNAIKPVPCIMPKGRVQIIKMEI